MDYCAAGSKTMILKVNIHCSSCERKITRAVKNINAESKIEFDRENDRVTVTGMLDPCKVIAEIGKAGKSAELIWLQTVIPTPNPNPKPNPNQYQNPNPNQYQNQNPPANIIQSPQNYPDQAQMAQLHSLSQVKNLNQVELINSKSITMKFNGSDPPKTETRTTKQVLFDSSTGSDHGSDGIHHRHSHHHHFYRPTTSGSTGGVPHEFFNGCDPPPSYNRTGHGPAAPPQPARPAYQYPNSYPNNNGPQPARPAYQYPNPYPNNNGPNDCNMM